MKQHILFWGFSLSALFFLATAQQLEAQVAYILENPRPFIIKASKDLKVAEIHRVLQERVETKYFQKEMLFKDFLVLLRNKLPGKGKHLGFIVDIEALWLDDPQPRMALDVPIKFPQFIPSLSAGILLKLAMSRCSPSPTFRVRKGYIEITSKKKAAKVQDIQLERRLVKGPLENVLDDLAEETGVNIVIDARCLQQAQAVVKAKFVSEIPLGIALEILTDMAGLRYVKVEDVFYITRPENSLSSAKKPFWKQMYPQELNGCLNKILDQLAEESNVNIVLDNRVQKEAQMAVKARFINPLSLSTGLEILADMAGLRCVVMGNEALYVTNPANAKNLERRKR